MTFPAPKPGFIPTIFTAFVLAAASTAHASNIGNDGRATSATGQVAATSAKAADASSGRLDCGPVIYDYGNTKVTKTVCSPPWTGPDTNAESGPAGSSSSTAQ